MSDTSVALPDDPATQAFASRAAAVLAGGLVIYLHGDLGAGKSTFARALLQSLGVAERIKSPTYSLVESYPLATGGTAWHLDLYRIADPGELEWLGLEAMGDPTALVLVEWPERGRGGLPGADVDLQLDYAGVGRRAHLFARSERGLAWVSALAQP